jgi:hypothetical protein
LRERLALWCSFIKLGTPPHLFLSQTMANRFHRVPTNFHIPWRSAFFIYLFFFFIFGIKQYGRWQIGPLRPHEMKTVSQNEKYFAGFLIGSTWKFTWNGLQIPCIGIFSWHIGKLGFWELDARVEIILSTKWRLAVMSQRLGTTKCRIRVYVHSCILKSG